MLHGGIHLPGIPSVATRASQLTLSQAQLSQQRNETQQRYNAAMSAAQHELFFGLLSGLPHRLY